MSSLVIPTALALIMYVVGLGLRVRDFTTLLHRPSIVAAGLGAQVVGLPVLAGLVAWTFGLAPAAALGLLLLACVPGGVTSNFLTVLARGDTALSVVLTVLTTTLGVVTVPLVLTLALSWFDPDDALRAGGLSLQGVPMAVLRITLVPMLLGMGTRWLWPAGVKAALKGARIAATLAFVLIVAAAVARDWSTIVDGWRAVGGAVIVFNMLATLQGLALGRLLGREERVTVTLALECSLQNVALALFLGGVVLGRAELLLPAVVYVLAMNASALALVLYRHRRTRSSNRATA